MNLPKLKKRLSSSYMKKMEVQAYEDESFWDELTALGDSLKSGGMIATDTLRVGPVEIHVTASSPIRVESDSTGVSASLTGSLSLEVGARINYPILTPAPQHSIPPPEHADGTYSARQDETRR